MASKRKNKTGFVMLLYVCMCACVYLCMYVWMCGWMDYYKYMECMDCMYAGMILMRTECIVCMDLCMNVLYECMYVCMHLYVMIFFGLE